MSKDGKILRHWMFIYWIATIVFINGEIRRWNYLGLFLFAMGVSAVGVLLERWAP